MAELKPCPYNNYNCMCQFCEDKCNNGLNCSDCEYHGEVKHTVYLCTGFKGDTVAYINNWKNGVTNNENCEDSKRSRMCVEQEGGR